MVGWLNAGTYLFYGAVTSTAAGIFLTDLAGKLFAPRHVPEWCFVFAWAVLAGVCWMAVRDIRGRHPGSLLVTEGLTITVILAVAAITLAG